MSKVGTGELLSRPVLGLVPQGPVAGSLAAPSSKSLTNRLLVVAGLAKGRSILGDVLESDDTTAMTEGLRALGVLIEGSSDRTEVTGTSGRPVAGGPPVNARLSGTTLRFLSGLGLLTNGPLVLDCEEPLRRRPITPLLDALRAAGAKITTSHGRPPFTIASDGFRGGRLGVDASASSQFATALLLVGPYADKDLVLEVLGLKELGYVRLSVETMTRWGAAVSEEDPGVFRVSAGATYKARTESVEHDASAAAHLYALAVATGGSVTVTNAFETTQPDAGLLEVLTGMGASFARSDAGTTIERRGRLTGITVDLAAMPDQLPTIAALGALAEGETVIHGVAIARGHETDRLRAVATELARLGGSVEESSDGLVVHGGSRLHGARVETYRDHRIAMAFTAIGAVVPGVEIADPGCVAKTYPGFFEDVSHLGVKIA